jgi:hypothetical protein
VTDALGDFKNDGSGEAVVLTGQSDELLAESGIDIGGVDDSEFS